MAAEPLFAGLMSGTSIDAIDAAVVRFPRSGGCEILAGLEHRYPEDLRRALLGCSVSSEPLDLADYAELDARVGEQFAEAAEAVLAHPAVDRAAVAGIGSHGQTVFHLPPRNSLQLGDPNRIAQRCRMRVVADLRRADMAAGGQGAPLAPAFHHAMLAARGEVRCVLNLGGIGNLSVLRGRSTNVIGFDTGPANGLLDEWTQAVLKQPFDRDGHFARRGRVDAPLLAALLDEPYFAQAPPKSTGRDRFNLSWCRRRFDGLERLAPEDIARTLLELSASTMADAVRRYAPEARQLFVCGGGIRNPLLMERIADQLPDIAVASTDAAGLPAKWMEAAAFAWLAKRRLQGRTGNLPSVTGAARPVVLGAIYRP